ncbi:unnamed protein product [Ilex paraguariensis]|uniref:EDS1 EP domain-containing protein n=1 Tax=Ilex paraguariensis TaxID=185542 RepID=A0ABC8T429_9AQUA
MQIYGKTLENLKNRAIYRGISSLGDCGINPLRAGIILQLQAIGVIRSQQQQESNVVKALITEIQGENIQIRRRKPFDPSKRLKDVKIKMMYLKWYIKDTEEQGGYYDSYKYARRRRAEDIREKEKIAKHKDELSEYWEKMVEEMKQIPQKEWAPFRTGLYSGNNCRRLIEPLDIAEYYNAGKKDYLKHGRAEHYILLEKWVNKDKPAMEPRSKACSRTEDSCFWAHVEEAMISCEGLKDGTSSTENRKSATQNLLQFERYMKGSIENLAVSPEIFLGQNSFMKLWREYEKLTGASYNSWLTDFMRNGYRSYA